MTTARAKLHKYLPYLISYQAYKGSVWDLFILLKLNHGRLRQLIQGPLPLVSEEDKVKDMVSSVGWNWARIPFELPSSCKKEIQATPFALTGTSQGRLI